MTATPGENPVKELRSLEVRWILPGQLDAAVAGWFGRFPAEMAAREDAYLLDPDFPGLSVKVRAGTALEVKVYHGSPGILDAEGRARGRIESWQKWSFPAGMLSQYGGDTAGWTVIRKSRRVSRFRLADGRIVAGVQGRPTEPVCAAELTEVRAGSETWWSLGFEATGPAGLLRSTLQSTAALVFAQAPPGDVELGMSHCLSYAEWLSRRPYRD
jgi:hypothetical protein